MEKTLTFHNFVILIKSVANKNKNEYYYNILLEKVCMNMKINLIQNSFKQLFVYYKCYFSI